MTWLTAYFDAAGHPDGAHSLIVGGYLSDVRAWLRFEKLWKIAIDEVGIEVFRMADFMACKGAFANWKDRDEERAALLATLARITRKNTRKSFAFAVYLDDWKRANQVYALETNHCTPYALCGFSIMSTAIKWLGKRDKKKDPVAISEFIFEDGDKHKGDFMWLMDNIIRKNRRDLAAISPIFKPKTLVPLQSADFIGWVYRKAVMKELQKMFPKASDSLLDLGMIPNTYGYLDYKHIVKFCEMFDVPKSGESRTWIWPAQA